MFMNQNASSPQSRTADPIAAVTAMTSQIKDDLEVAGAELSLTNTVLDRSLPDSAKHGDVARALEQNTEIEEKVQAAVEDLKVVTQLLHEEVAETARLNQELSERPANGAAATGQP
jgi:hypothetical protein